MMRPFLMACAFGFMATGAVGAPAETEGDRVFYQFGAGKLLVYGRYSRAANSTEDGQSAESRARHEGLTVLKRHVDGACTGEGGSALKDAMVGKGDISQELTSLGSELFPDGTILVKLSAKMSSVFSGYPGRQVTPSGFVFSLPNVPSRFVRCGLVNLRISAEKVIPVLPVPIANPPAGITAIRLIVSGGELRVADKAQAEVLSSADLTPFESGGVTAIPVLR